jgi:hypothetical protein
MAMARSGGRVWIWVLAVAAVAVGVWIGLDYVGRHRSAGGTGEYTVF